MRDFIFFIRSQGVVGLAIGFILGGAVNGVISSFVKDILQPIISFVIGSDSIVSLHIGTIYYGRFMGSVLDFMLLAAVVYFVFKKLKLDSLDLKEEKIIKS